MATTRQTAETLEYYDWRMKHTERGHGRWATHNGAFDNMQAHLEELRDEYGLVLEGEVVKTVEEITRFFTTEVLA